MLWGRCHMTNFNVKLCEFDRYFIVERPNTVWKYSHWFCIQTRARVHMECEYEHEHFSRHFRLWYVRVS